MTKKFQEWYLINGMLCDTIDRIISVTDNYKFEQQSNGIGVFHVITYTGNHFAFRFDDFNCRISTLLNRVIRAQKILLILQNQIENDTY